MHREVKQITPGHASREQRRWDVNTGTVARALLLPGLPAEVGGQEH